MTEQADKMEQRDTLMTKSYGSSPPKMPSPASSTLQRGNMELYCTLTVNVKVARDDDPIQIPSPSSSAPEFEVVGTSMASDDAHPILISPPSSSFISAALSWSPSQNRPATRGNLEEVNSTEVEAVGVDKGQARLMSPTSSPLSLARSMSTPKTMHTTVSAVAPISKYTNTELPSPASTIDLEESPKNIWAAAILRAQASNPAVPVMKKLRPGPVSTPDVVESGPANALPAPSRDTSRYIDNPNNNRDDFWEDKRRYPEDYYSIPPPPPPKYTAAERAGKETRDKAKEYQFLRNVVAKRVADEKERKTERWIYVAYDLKKLVYRFRDGAFAGQEIDKLPEWYKEELMSGGERRLIDTDRALYLTMHKKGYRKWTIEYPLLKLERNPGPPRLLTRRGWETRNEGEEIGEKRKRDSGVGCADDSDDNRITSMPSTDTSARQQKRIKLSIHPSQAPDSLPASRDLPFPAQPTQAPGPVSASQHGKETLPGFIRNDEGFAFPLPFPHLACCRDQRKFFSTSSESTIGALLVGMAGPPAEWKNGTSGVDRWMLDRLNSVEDMFMGRADGEFREGVYKKFGY